jgi:hypothetical protein
MSRDVHPFPVNFVEDEKNHHDKNIDEIDYERCDKPSVSTPIEDINRWVLGPPDQERIDHTKNSG